MTIDLPYETVQKIEEYLEHINHDDGEHWQLDEEQIITMVENYMDVVYFENGCITCNMKKKKEKE
jgi:hypothetical protein